MPPQRALLIVLDSVGVGHAPDAAQYGDEGADTLGHILARCPDLKIPNLMTLGLAHMLESAPQACAPTALYGRMRERSAGKDTTTGHWEIAGVVLDRAFATFEEFPPDLVAAIEQEAGTHFIGNYPQSGTTVLEELGEEHLHTGHPILYTSADSVMQIAAHEDITPVEELYRICTIARKHCDPHRIGRVIARPFSGSAGSFQRTSRRHDFSAIPPHTVLNTLTDAGIPVAGIGKISDIFAACGIPASHPTTSNSDGMATIERLWATGAPGLFFANLVDFDMLFGHRRDVEGYANALAQFDQWLGQFLPTLPPDDLLIITADHGNDPTWLGTNHTREEVPVLIKHGGHTGPLGTRESFADIAATVADYFGVPIPPTGTSMLVRITISAPLADRSPSGDN